MSEVWWGLEGEEGAFEGRAEADEFDAFEGLEVGKGAVDWGGGGGMEDGQLGVHGCSGVSERLEGVFLLLEGFDGGFRVAFEEMVGICRKGTGPEMEDVVAVLACLNA